MTKKEDAIGWFTMIREKFTGTKYGEYLDIAIKALEQEPCEECISRKRVIILIDEAAEKYPYKIIGLPNTYSDYNQGWTDACDWLYANIESDNLPSVTPKPKIGKWITVDSRNCYKILKCSGCGREVTFYHEFGYTPCDSDVVDRFPYCPCGVKMEVKE